MRQPLVRMMLMAVLVLVLVLVARMTLLGSVLGVVGWGEVRWSSVMLSCPGSEPWTHWQW